MSVVVGAFSVEEAAEVMASEAWRLEDDPAEVWGSAASVLSRGLLSRRASGPWQVRLVHVEAGLYLFEVAADGSACVFMRRGPVVVLPAGAVEVPRSREVVSSSSPVSSAVSSASMPVRGVVGVLRRGLRRSPAPAPAPGQGVGGVVVPGGCVRCGAVLPSVRVECASCGLAVPVLEGAHAGAGVSCLAVASGLRDGGVLEERMAAVSAARLLVARTHQVGLDAARRALAEDRAAGVVRRVLLVPDAPGRLPKPLADQVAVIAAAAEVTRVPWVEAWRWAPGSPSATFTEFFPVLAGRLLG